MQKKRASIKGEREASDVVYKQAFRLFTQGRSNEQIEKECRLGQMSLVEALEPSIELVLDHIEKLVTKNVKFHRSTTYFVRRKQFVSDIILRRTAILHSRTFQPAQKDLISEFLSICQYFAVNSSLDGYVYLKLELIFDKVYYSPKKDQIESSHTEPTIATLPKKRSRSRSSKPNPPKVSEGVVNSSPPAKEVTDTVDRKALGTVSPEVSKRENILVELESKKKMIESLRLQHQILVKKSKILEMEAEINQMEHQIGIIATPQSIISPVQPTQIPVPIVANSFTPTPPTHVETTTASSKVKRQRQPSRLKKIPKGAVIQTLISSQESQQMKAEESAQVESEAQGEMKQEVMKQEEDEDEDEDEEYVANFKDEEKRPKKISARRKPILKPILKEPNAAKKEPPKRKVSIDKRLEKQDHTFKRKKEFRYEQEDEIAQLSEEILPKRRKRQNAVEQRIIVPPQDYFSTNWHPDEERYLVDQLQKVTVLNVSKVSKELNLQFGKKERFKLYAIRQKKSAMFKLCRRKFLAEVSKRKSLNNQEIKTLSAQLQNIDNRSSFQFINRFLHQYYFSNLDIVVNKALNDTLAIIATLRQRHDVASTPIRSHTPSGPEVDNYAAKETDYADSSQVTSSLDSGAKRTYIREMTRLGISEKDMETVRKRVAQVKVEVKKEPKTVYAETNKPSDIYYEDNQTENNDNQQTQEPFAEKKNANSANNNLKSAFQNFIEPQEKVGG